MNFKLANSFNIGNQVVCDMCDEDFTGSNAKGGILFGGRACCPKCALRIEASARKYGEFDHIKARCPAGVTFYNWCLSLRNGDNEVRIYKIS